MTIKLESAFRKIEKQRSEILADLDQLSEAQRQFKPTKDSWNTLQVCMHLIIAEENSLAYMRKKVKGIDKLSSSGLWSKLRLSFLNSLVSTRMKFKAPKIVALSEDMDVGSYEEVKSRWDNIRKELRYFVDKLDHKASKKMLFKHPMAGKFNVEQLLNFIFTHVQHHTYQIDRLKKHSNFPAK